LSTTSLSSGVVFAPPPDGVLVDGAVRSPIEKGLVLRERVLRGARAC